MERSNGMHKILAKHLSIRRLTPWWNKKGRNGRCEEQWGAMGRTRRIETLFRYYDRVLKSDAGNTIE